MCRVQQLRVRHEILGDLQVDQLPRVVIDRHSARLIEDVVDNLRVGDVRAQNDVSVLVRIGNANVLFRILNPVTVPGKM